MQFSLQSSRPVQSGHRAHSTRMSRIALKGIAGLRRAQAGYYARRFGVAEHIGVALSACGHAAGPDGIPRLEEAVDVIRQNYGMSIAVNAVGLVVSAGGALSPVVAAILHNASSVAVVAITSPTVVATPSGRTTPISAIGDGAACRRAIGP